MSDRLPAVRRGGGKTPAVRKDAALQAIVPGTPVPSRAAPVLSDEIETPRLDRRSALCWLSQRRDPASRSSGDPEKPGSRSSNAPAIDIEVSRLSRTVDGHAAGRTTRLAMFGIARSSPVRWRPMRAIEAHQRSRSR